MVNFSDVLNNRPKFEPLTSSKKQPCSKFDLIQKNEQVVEQVNYDNSLKYNNSKVKPKPKIQTLLNPLKIQLYKMNRILNRLMNRYI
jgi:hypothetical protein